MTDSNGAVADPPIPGQQDLNGGEAAPPPLDRIVVAGTGQLVFSDGGGKEPQTATLSLTGAKADVRPGEGFTRDQIITGSFVARVVQASPVSALDKKTGIVSEAVQVCKAVVTDLTVDDHSSG